MDKAEFIKMVEGYEGWSCDEMTMDDGGQVISATCSGPCGHVDERVVDDIRIATTAWFNKADDEDDDQEWSADAVVFDPRTGNQVWFNPEGRDYYLTFGDAAVEAEGAAQGWGSSIEALLEFPDKDGEGGHYICISNGDMAIEVEVCIDEGEEE